VTPERWKQVEAVLERALELPSEEWPAFFNRSCNGDEELRREVESLIEAQASAGSFIDRPSRFFSGDMLADQDPLIQPGELIGPYRVVREIGRGGIGAVYLAERADEQYQKQVAIKLIKRGMDTDSVLRHFRNERQILASFDHPNIARLFDGGTATNGLPYFVMEYVEGLPIDTYCRTQALSITERLTLFREVCAAVAYAHRHAVIHRDIKPSNILVTSDGRPKLLDFGIAKILQPGSGVELSVTATGLRLMTPEYASPEQVRGQPVTTATDSYSLGVVLYHLLTGRGPYRIRTRTPEEVSRAIAEQEPQKPSTAVAKRDPNLKSLRGDLDNIMLMALRKEPGRRYQSVEQFSEDIRRHLEALPVQARKDTLGYRAAKFVRRNKAATAAAALVFVTLLGGIIATTWEAHRARLQEAFAVAEKTVAERRFNDVRKLAHSVLFDYHDAIKDLPGATRVRERLVKDAVAYLDSLAREASGDPALQHELASAYERVGDVRGLAYSASLGDRAGAMDSYLKALRIREAVVKANPHDSHGRQELAENHKKIGWQLLDTGEASRGMEHLRKAATLYAELTTEKPEDAELRDQLAHTYDRLGIALENSGDWKSALDQLRQGLVLREKLVADQPANPEYRRRLSVTDQSISRALYLSGDIAGALDVTHKAQGLQETLVAEDPTNASYRRNLAVSYEYDGGYRGELGDKSGSLDGFRKAMAVNEELVAADPANAQACSDLARLSAAVADLLAETANDSQALVHYRKSVQMYEKTSAKAPEDLHQRFWLAISQAGVGKMQARLGQKTSALEECRKTISLLGEIAEEPTSAELRSLKAQAYGELGELYAALGTSKEASAAEARQHWTAARDMFQRSLDIYEDMRRRGIFPASKASRRDEIVRQVTKCGAALQK
jgi:eukaryotic-like serine/threonine-protein kinase